jgi:transcription termination factor Rho
MGKQIFEDDSDDFVPERFSADFGNTDEDNESGGQNVSIPPNSDGPWSSRRGMDVVDDDLAIDMAQKQGKPSEGRNFSTQVDGQSGQYGRHRQKQQNNQRQSDRQSANENKSRRDGDRHRQNSGNGGTGSNGCGNRKQQSQNGNQGHQKFAKMVKIGQLSSGQIKAMDCMCSFEKLEEFANENINFDCPPFDFNGAYENRASLSPRDIADDPGISDESVKNCHGIFELLLAMKFSEKTPIVAKGVLETVEGGDGLLVYANDNYRIRAHSAFISKFFIQRFGLRRGQDIVAYLHPPSQNSTCPFVLKLSTVVEMDPLEALNLPKFKDLIPFYPTERIFLECTDDVKWDNVSMRIIDILTPIGLGQRGLIVAPPRTGKTVLLQCIANAISKNRPDAKLIILLIDERPEEVTDFCRQVANAEIISSTFDESTDNHVHAADMVIDKARRQVEAGKHVVILLDSITRLARAHNTEQPSSGKLLSGGVDANALQAPKKFFGAARNIEGGGSLTILATALVETGSRMDEVIFEEFKGTGNMELHLDRTLVDKRMFPALNIEKSGTRKEELLYHPDEMEKVYALRRAIKGVQPVDAMEMLIQRIRKTKTNMEFLIGVNR